MKKACLGLILLTLSAAVSAAPFFRADPYPTASTPKPTHCGIYLDTGAKIEIVITSGTSGPYCNYDGAQIAPGAHAIKATHIIKDATWGNQESDFSNTVNFTRPGPPAEPTGFGLKAQ